MDQGQSKDLQANISGAGKVMMGGVQAKDANVSVSGSAKLTLWATDSLHVSSSGSSHVEYRGEPKVTSQASGAVRLKSID